MCVARVLREDFEHAAWLHVAQKLADELVLSRSHRSLSAVLQCRRLPVNRVDLGGLHHRPVISNEVLLIYCPRCCTHDRNTQRDTKDPGQEKGQRSFVDARHHTSDRVQVT